MLPSELHSPKSLEISSEWANRKGGPACRDAILNELRDLRIAYQDDRQVRLVLAEALFAAGATGRLNGAPDDDFFAEVYSIVCAHPDDDTLAEFFNARFKFGVAPGDGENDSGANAT
jgi:hypothetical protein